ncbi:MAG: serine O-acetyltransferase [Spongiibacteraceae bacterium]
MSERNSTWLWQQIRGEGEVLVSAEPLLASFFHSTLLNHASLEDALAFLLANQLGNTDVQSMLLQQVCKDAYASEPELIDAATADSLAHYDRDPACKYFSMPLLYFKGFQAVQAYRVANWLWRQQRRAIASFLQNRIAEVFDIDIHPAATIGSGLMVDHGTGVVIGATAVLGNNISMLHSVTLGGSGVGAGRRHPCVGDGVLIASGAKLLGPISVGRDAKIAAGSVVLNDVAEFSTVAGVPARAVGGANKSVPAQDMNQCLDDG